MHVQALDIRNELPEESRQGGVGEALQNLGRVHFRRYQIANCAEELEKSLGLYTEAHKIKERLAPDGKADVQVAKSLNYIGTVHAYKNDNIKALECFEKSLEIQKQVSAHVDALYCEC